MCLSQSLSLRKKQAQTENSNPVYRPSVMTEGKKAEMSPGRAGFAGQKWLSDSARRGFIPAVQHQAVVQSVMTHQEKQCISNSESCAL